MRPVRQVLQFPAAATASVAALQTTAGAAALTLTASTVVVAGPNAPQVQVTLTSGGNDSAINFTITGTDYRGQVVSEVLAGPNTNTVTSVNSYATITSITTSGAVGTNVSAGNAQAGSSPVVVFNQYSDPFSVSLSLTFTGTANVTVQYTNDPIFVGQSLDSLNWFNDSSLTSQAANNMASLVAPVSAARAVFNSGSGTVAFTATQAGI